MFQSSLKTSLKILKYKSEIPAVQLLYKMFIVFVLLIILTTIGLFALLTSMRTLFYISTTLDMMVIIFFLIKLLPSMQSFVNRS